MNGPGQDEFPAIMAGLLCGLLIGVPLMLAIGAVILRAACAIFNKLCQPQNCVPEVSFLKAMLIVFLSGLTQNILGCPIGMGVGIVSGAAQLPPEVAQGISFLITMPLGLLISASLFMLMLPTTFGRGLLVALIQWAIVLVVAIAVGVVVFVVLIAVKGVGGVG